MTRGPVIIEAAINGATTKEKNPHVPRTAEELAREAGMRGAAVLVGRAYEGDGAPPYWPWIQVLRAASSIAARQYSTR